MGSILSQILRTTFYIDLTGLDEECKENIKDVIGEACGYYPYEEDIIVDYRPINKEFRKYLFNIYSDKWCSDGKMRRNLSTEEWEDLLGFEYDHLLKDWIPRYKKWVHYDFNSFLI